MFQVIHKQAEEFGPGVESFVVGIYATKEEATAAAHDSGLECRISAYRLTPQQASRAALLARLGRKYVPASVEVAGKWVGK